MSGNFYPPWSIDMMAIFAAIVTASFLVHEVAHKVRLKTGMWAEFRLTLWGAILTFASGFLPFFKMIDPEPDDSVHPLKMVY
jgi:cytochrome c oxidase assembly factor CtaG